MKPSVTLALLALHAGPAAAQVHCSARMGDLPDTWEGSVFAVSGDTLAAVGLRPRIRLWGIRAPELHHQDPSVAAMRARAALEDMLGSGSHRVACRTTGWDHQGCHAIAQCTITASWPAGSTAQPHDLALRLVEDGFAYGFDLGSPPSWDDDASAKIAHFEGLSRQARKGLWPDWLGERPKP